MKYAYRLSPCPAYAVADTECWLGQMAEKGFMLSENGFFGGVGVFEKSEPKRVRYRLEAAPQSTSLWSDNGGLPEGEQRDMMADEGWEYVCNRGDFYIYRASSPDAAKPNTDPAVQALTLSAVVKRRRSSLFSTIFYLIFYPVIVIKGGVISLMLGTGSYYILLLMLLLIWSTLGSLKEYLSLRSMEKKLRRGLPLPSGRINPKKTARHRLGGLLYILLIIVFAVMSVSVINHRAVSDEREVPFAKYEGDLPFPELGELMGGQYMADGYGEDTVEEWDDLLARRCIKFFQSGSVHREAGGTVEAILRVEYYELKSPIAASMLVREIHRADRSWSNKKYYAPADFAPPDGDYSAVYYYLHQQILLLQKGNVVIRAYIAPLGEKRVPFEQWAASFAESVGQ